MFAVSTQVVSHHDQVLEDVPFPLIGFAVADITPTLNETVTKLSEQVDFSTETCKRLIIYLNLLDYRANCDSAFCQELGSALCSLYFVELFKRIWKQYFNVDLFSPRVVRSALWYNLLMLSDVMTTLSHSSMVICASIAKYKVDADLVKYLGSELVKIDIDKGDKTEGVLKLAIVASFIRILYNVIKVSAESRETLRICQAVKMLHPVREYGDELIAVLVLIVQAFLITDEERELISCSTDSLEFLLGILNSAMNCQESYRLSVTDVLEAMSKLAVNDTNKVRLVQAGSLPYFVQLLQPNRSEEERKQAAHGLWILRFKCREDISREPGCAEGKPLDDIYADNGFL